MGRRRESRKKQPRYVKRDPAKIGQIRRIPEWNVSIRKGHGKPLCKFFAQRPYYDPFNEWDGWAFAVLRRNVVQKTLLTAARMRVYNAEYDYAKLGKMYWDNPYTFSPKGYVMYLFKFDFIQTELNLLYYYVMKEDGLVSENSVLALLRELELLAIRKAKDTGDIEDALKVVTTQAAILGMYQPNAPLPTASLKTKTGRKKNTIEPPEIPNNNKNKLLADFKKNVKSQPEVILSIEDDENTQEEEA